MHHDSSRILSAPDASELFSELSQFQVAIIQYVTGFSGYAQSLRFAVRALLKSQRPAFATRQSQITDSDFICFGNRRKVSRG